MRRRPLVSGTFEIWATMGNLGDHKGRPYKIGLLDLQIAGVLYYYNQTLLFPQNPVFCVTFLVIQYVFNHSIAIFHRTTAARQSRTAGCFIGKICSTGAFEWYFRCKWTAVAQSYGRRLIAKNQYFHCFSKRTGAFSFPRQA